MGVEAVEVEGGVVRMRRGCSCAKDDFLPEESFKSWGNYVKALKETPGRFRDRILARSMDRTELVEMKARSQNEMKKTLNWWDLMWLGMGGVIGAGIFVLTGVEAREAAGPAIVLSYVVSGVSALLSVFCYTEFAVEIPVAGGSFAYLRVELGDFMAFIAAGNIILEYIIGAAAVARAWTSYFATLCNHEANDFRIKAHGLSEEYSHLDPIAVIVLAIICVIAILSTKGSSRINYVASIVHVVIIVFIIIAGLANANTANYTPFAPFGPRGIFQASAVIFFAYLGFDSVATMAEETKNPGRDIPIGLVGSMVITTALYCLLALTICLMQPYSQIDKDAAFSVAFEAVGMGWAKYIVAAGALKGMTSVLLVGAVSQARYVTHIARTHMIPPWLAQVNKRTGTPINATVVMQAATAIIALFSELEILAKLLSISTLFIFMLVALALIVRRYYVSGVTSKLNRIKLIFCLAVILGSSTGTSIYWANSEGWIGYVISVPILFLGTLGLWVFVPQARTPKIWGVPLVPWLPSASIAINIFLLGSIDKASFVRFGLWTGFILIYYFLFGLHASYESAKEYEEKGSEDETQLKKVEEGNMSSAVKDFESGGYGGDSNNNGVVPDK
ncbi:Amino acid/polyamine transporter [Parasponia andersonii]|uniref:Amino acid/polyamine transporter n=1 Tax=Parasponia andersonii TaxID=3476 RepID=A0A2P5C149_PARAD|nr:Amino acid/polyamine transporter [Parasponia andersonii]